MGGCASTLHQERRRRGFGRHRHRSRRSSTRFRRGSAKLVIPVSGASLENAAQVLASGNNVMTAGSPASAFVIEKEPLGVLENGVTRRKTIGNANGDHQSSARQSLSRNLSIGSNEETWYDAEEEADNSEEYLTVHEFWSMNDFLNTKSAPASTPSSQRPSYSALREGMAKVEAWIAGTSGRAAAPDSPVGSSSPGIDQNGGTDNAVDPRVLHSKSLGGGLRKEKVLQMTASEKGVNGRGKLERPVALAVDEVGRRPSASETSPGCSSRANTEGSSGRGEKGKTSCLPRFPLSFNSRSRPQSPQVVSLKRKGPTKCMSFKRRGAPHDDAEPDEFAVPSKFILARPIAGSQIPRCSPEKPLDGCWSAVSSSAFKLRGLNYAKDKKKLAAPDLAVFEPIGVDLFMSPRKIAHVAQFVELPFQDLRRGPENLPVLLIVNIQLPMYQPPMFGTENDGNGLNLVLYFKLSEAGRKQAPPHLKETLKKFLEDETESVKGFVGDTQVPFRDRLKLVSRLVNPDEVKLGGAEKQLVSTYNEKPILTRPQHVFYKESNYLEVDLDVHRFAYLARKGLDMFRERLKDCVIDIGFTIQTSTAQELPEHLLGGIRLNRVDPGIFRVLPSNGAEATLPAGNAE